MEFAFVGAKMSVFVLKYASQHFRKATAIHIFVPMKIPPPVNCYFMQPEKSPTVHEQITRCLISLNSLFLISALVSPYFMS